MNGRRGEAPTDRGTIVQRLRVAGIRVLGAGLASMPQGVADGLAEAAGEAWYRLAPTRADQARRNLARVVAYCAATGTGSRRVQAAAADPAALERLVRAAFRHLAIVYLQMLRGPVALRRAVDRLVIETPEVLDAAVARGGPAIFVTMHFGSIDVPAMYLATRFGKSVAAPVETLADPALQRLFDSRRRAIGTRVVPLEHARRELRASLARGEVVGLVADRDITGGGIPMPLFGAPAPIPAGPALLALDAGAPLHLATVRRAADGGWLGHVVTLPEPPAGSLRSRAEAILAGEAAVFERLVIAAPEQWWAVFHPIWADDNAEDRPATGPGPDAAPELDAVVGPAVVAGGRAAG